MSLFEKLKDKINYKLFKALDDPEASTFAAENAQQKAEENAEKQKREKQASEKEQRQQDLAAKEEANKPKSVLNEVFEIFIKVLVYGIGAFLVALSGSMVANTAIHRHPLMRILYFIFGSLVGLIILIFALPFPPIIFIILFIWGIMSWLDYLPHCYNFLPLIQYETTTNIFYKTLQEYVIAWDPLDEKNKKYYNAKITDYIDILKSSLAAAPKEAPKEA